MSKQIQNEKTEITETQFSKLCHVANQGGFATKFGDSILGWYFRGYRTISAKQAALLDKLFAETSHRGCKCSQCTFCYPNDGEELAS